VLRGANIDGNNVMLEANMSMMRIGLGYMRGWGTFNILVWLLMLLLW
jgi:hypothetical protein